MRQKGYKGAPGKSLAHGNTKAEARDHNLDGREPTQDEARVGLPTMPGADEARAQSRKWASIHWYASRRLINARAIARRWIQRAQ
jgi:hypothetical protein